MRIIITMLILTLLLLTGCSSRLTWKEGYDSGYELGYMKGLDRATDNCIEERDRMLSQFNINGDYMILIKDNITMDYIFPDDIRYNLSIRK